MFGKKAIVISTTVWATACSPYVYEKEIKGFNSGVQNLKSSYSGGITQAKLDEKDVIRWQWINANGRAGRVSHGCSNFNTADIECGLLAVNPDAAVPQVKDAQLIADTIKLLGELAAYASALSAISNAKDSADLSAAQGKVSKALSGIAGAANLAAGPIVGVLVDTLNWVGLNALETRRYVALKREVTRAHPAIQEIGQGLERNVAAWPKDLRTVALAEKIRLLEDAVARSSGAERRVRVDLLAAATVEYEALRQNDPATAARKMVEAHLAMRDALNDGSRQFEAVAAAIKQFSESARTLKEAFRKT